MVFAGRNVAHIRQIPEKLLDVTVQPLMFVLLFAYVFGGAIDVGGGSYREYIIAGILDPVADLRHDGSATAIATDLTEGVIDRFRSLPASGRPTCWATTSPSSAAWCCRSSCCSAPACSSAGAPTPAAVMSLGALCSCCVRLGDDLDRNGLGLKVRAPDAVMGVGSSWSSR